MMERQKKTLLAATAVFSASALFGVVAVLLAAGCASNTQTSAPTRPGSGIAEYRQAVTRAQKAIGSALGTLATVSAQSSRCSPETVSNFCAEVRLLQVESLQVRARSEAMQARGDDYFEHWHQRMKAVKDPDVRALAEQHRAQLQQSFTEIKRLSHEKREAFQPFIVNLRKLRNALEKDPASLSSGQAQEWLKTAKENGDRVDHSLAGIEHELDSMRSMITPPGKAGPKGKEG